MQGEDCIVRRKGVIGPRAGAGEGAGAGSGAGEGAGAGAGAGEGAGAGAVVGSDAWVWDMGSSRSVRAGRTSLAMALSHCSDNYCITVSGRRNKLN